MPAMYRTSPAGFAHDFSPTWIAAMPNESDVQRTLSKPAARIRAASSSSAGKFGDRLRQISIGSAVATHGSADQRQHVVKIELIENAHQRLARCCELEDHEASSPLEHAMQLGERGVEITHIANAKRDDRSSGAFWCQWQL